jgi:hypothetical protein
MTAPWEAKLTGPLKGAGAPVVDIKGAETAWPVAKAPELIEWLHKNRHAVLGGDFYAKKGGLFEPTYDNWHCVLQPGEEWAAYIDRSRTEALKGLKKGSADMWIVIVAASRPTAEQLEDLKGR